MTGENVWQILVALVAIIPGVAALLRQIKRDEAEKTAAARDDNRDDFKELFAAARELGDAGSTLIQPLTNTIQKLRVEIAERDRLHQLEYNEIEVRLAAAERELAELKRINEELYNENSKLLNQLEFYRKELSRLAKYEPADLPREPRAPKKPPHPWTGDSTLPKE